MGRTPRVEEYLIAYIALSGIVAAILTGLAYVVFVAATMVPRHWLAVFVIAFILSAIGLRRYRAYKVVSVDE